MLKGVKPGSILLFHNDLENTTEALPEILANLKSQGYKFVTVKELILKDNFTIDPNGVQKPSSEDAVKISDEKLAEVLAMYSDKISALGLSEEQIAQASAAIKNGDISALPKELQPFAQEVLARINEVEVLAPNNSGTTSGSTSSDINNSGIPEK